MGLCDGEGLLIFALKPDSVVSKWNERCRATFPQDELQVNDLIIDVNGVRAEQGQETMKKELSTSPNLLLVVARRC